MQTIELFMLNRGMTIRRYCCASCIDLCNSPETNKNHIGEGCQKVPLQKGKYHIAKVLSTYTYKKKC